MSPGGSDKDHPDHGGWSRPKRVLLMRLAILSDVHANIHALTSVWEDIERQGPEAVYCLGDLVGYGAFPNEVIEFVRTRSIPTVMGNYDQGVGFDLDDCGCACRTERECELTDLSLLWSRRHTRPDNKAYLRSLPEQIRFPVTERSVLLVHGSPRRINEYMYEDRAEATFERVAAAAVSDVLFFGHTHLPYQKRVAGTLFVNTGSVGKPKDGDPRAGYVLASLGEAVRIDMRRVEYDVGAAAAAIRASDLPDEFAGQLETGGWLKEREGAPSGMAPERRGGPG